MKTDEIKKSTEKNRKRRMKKSEEKNKAKAQRPYLEELARDIINYVKKYGIHVLRYDAKTSESIYLKFDYGISGSLRISAHDSKVESRYTFNIIKGLETPFKEKVKVDDNKFLEVYYYPDSLYKNVAKDIVRFKDFKIDKYGRNKYELYYEENKLKIGTNKGFCKEYVEA